MKKNKLFKIALLFLIINACNRSQTSKDYVNHFSGDYKGRKEIEITKLTIDSINFPDIESSFEGNFYVRNNKLIFFDKYFGYAFQFDNKGKLEDKFYGQGQGPLEVNTGYVDGYLPLNSGQDLFIGSSLDFHIHKQDGERNKRFILPWKYKEDEKSRRKLRRTNDFTGDEVGLYELNYELLQVREDKNGFIYLPLVAFSDMINPYKSDFYNRARLLAKVDLNTGKIIGMFGRISPEYKKYKAIVQHMFFSYDISMKSNDMYVSSEIDSLIYVYNDAGKNIYTFGNAGKNMNTDYLEIPTFEIKNFRKAYFEDRPLRGYYASVEYLDEFDLLFRGYAKGKDSATDGLQIYKGTTLVADVDVPKGFTGVKGYIAPYFYSNAIVNDEAMTLKGYRFTLPKELLK